MKFFPEGNGNYALRKYETIDEVRESIMNCEIIEGTVLLCDKEHNLHVDLGVIRGIIPRNEGALGIEEGLIRDIALISKVNKRVCFMITGLEKDLYGNYIALLSRRSVQQWCAKEYLFPLSTGDIIDARVTHLERFGAFIDIGAGINALIPIDMLSVSRISHPSERLQEGDRIRVVLRKREPEKLTFSLKELLGTWRENADCFASGETVTGIVRSIEDYGVFVELTPNLAGLAEPYDNLSVGQEVAVFIKSIIEDKMKIKLIIVEAFDKIKKPQPIRYYINDSHIDYWSYSPESGMKQVFTDFSAQ